MGNVRINLPDELHWDLKRRAIDERIPLKELITKALEEYLKQHPPGPTLFDRPARKSQNE